MIIKYLSLQASYSKLKHISLKSCRKIDLRKYDWIRSSSLPFTISKRTFSNCNQSHKYLLSLGNKYTVSDVYVLSRSLSTSAYYRSRNLGNDFHDPKPPGGQPKPNGLRNVIIFLIVFILANKFFSRTSKVEKELFISWEEFRNEMLAKGEVAKVVLSPSSEYVMIYLNPGAIVKNQRVRQHVYLMVVPDPVKFEDKLREAEKQLGISPKDGVLIEYRNTESNKIWLTLLILLLILYFLSSSKMKNFKMPIISDMMNFKKAKFTLIDPLAGQGKGVKFSDVAGLKEAKIEIMEFVDYLKRPEYYRNLGAKVPKGALLLGPPGCGKTLLAKAVATEANVPFLSMNGSEFIEMIGGLGAARVRDLFKEAKKRIPCIVYIDEIDAIGKKRWSREESGNAEGEQTLNQLLVEMDGMVSNDGVILLASTNRAEVLDSALLRPGRFDRQILIDLPTYEERREIFEQHLKSIHLEHEPSHYSKRLAHLTPGFSGANIANVCNEAALHAARHKKQIVRGEDLEYAVERVIGGTEKRSSAMTPEEKKMFAFSEAGRALVGWLNQHGEALLKITIVPRTESPAGWTQFSQGDKFIYSKEELMGKMCMALGGRVAVSLVFNKVTTGGEKDLKKVTRLAYAQVRQYGMNEKVGLMSFTIGDEEATLKKPYSKHLAAIFDEEARRLITAAYKETERILLENKDKLFKLAEELLKRETLNYNDVVQLIGPPPHSGKKLIEPFEFDLSLNQAAGPEPEPQPEREREREREPDSERESGSKKDE